MKFNPKVNIFATIKEEIRFNRVTYYSICLEGQEDSLFMQFVDNHDEKKYEEPLFEIQKWIRKIGDEIGAQESYFRKESFRGGDTSAFPPPARYLEVECNLRLYCMRINDNIVILFNGAEKTAATAQKCEKVYPHFLQANKLSKAIYTAIIDKDIEIDEEDGCLIYDESLEIEI